MASIRNLGDCPCPRCKIKLSKVHNLGMPMDRTQRRTQARFDDDIRRQKISEAREHIYEEGYIVNSAEIERQLKPESLVPTAVCFTMLQFNTPPYTIYFRMPFQRGYHPTNSTCFRCLLLIYCTSLRLGSGGHYLFTCFVFWIVEMVSFTKWTNGEI